MRCKKLFGLILLAALLVALIPLTTSADNELKIVKTEAKTYWVLTNPVSENRLEQGYTVQLKEKHRLKLYTMMGYEYVSVYGIADTFSQLDSYYTDTLGLTKQPTLLLTFDTQENTVLTGQEIKSDLNNDGYYDLSVKLEDILEHNVSLTIKKINEQIISGKDTEFEDPETIKEKETSTPSEGNGITGAAIGEGNETSASSWKSLGILCLVVFCLIVLFVLYKRKVPEETD